MMGFGKPVVGGVLDKSLSSAPSGRAQTEITRQPGANATSGRPALGQSAGLRSWDFQAKTCKNRRCFSIDDVEKYRLLDVNLIANRFKKKKKKSV